LSGGCRPVLVRVGGESVGVDVDAQDLPEAVRGEVLGVAGSRSCGRRIRVVAAAAVARSRRRDSRSAPKPIQPPLWFDWGWVKARTGVPLAASARSGFAETRIAADAGGGIGQVDVEEAVRRVVGVEGEAEEALLAALADAGDREERASRRGSRTVAAQDADLASVLLDDEDALEVAGRRRQVDGLRESRSRRA
jgi:hypothetical protein